MSTYQCPTCTTGKEYTNLTLHFHHSDHGYPDIEPYRDMLEGILLGDASIDTGGRGHSRLSWIMINKEFVEWFSEELGWLGTEPRLHMTGEEAKESTGFKDPVSIQNSDFQDQYHGRTRNHPKFTEWRDRFYTEDGKIIPDDLTLNWEILRFWYISDGTIQIREDRKNPRMQITAVTYLHGQRDRVRELFEELGLSPRLDDDKISFRVDDTRTIINNTEPVPGFEYKWPEKV